MGAPRSAGRAVGAVLVATIVSFGAASPALAEGESDNPQENLAFWYSTYGVDAAHAAGLTGAGVKVGVIEKQINPDLPVFEGRNLRISDFPICSNAPEVKTADANSAARHGTTMTALLIGNGTGSGNINGVAPDADVTVYGYGPESDERCDVNSDEDISEFGLAVKTAVDDGNEIVYTAVGQPWDERDAPVIAYAIAKGVAVVSASANPSQLGDSETSVGALNGVVTTTAIDREGHIQKSSDGSDYVITHTTVVAGGFRIPGVGREGDWSATGSGTGSSNTAPLVAGMLALAAQKTPQATGNQLVQALIATTNDEVHTPARTDDGYGYGAAWLSSLLSVDPLQYPDETPLMDKPAGMPTAEQIATAKTQGYVAPAARSRSFDAYGDEPSGFDIGALVPWIIGAVVGFVVLAIVITIVIITISRRRKAEGGKSS